LPSEITDSDTDSSPGRGKTNQTSESAPGKIRYDVRVKTSSFSDRGEAVALKLLGGTGQETSLVKLNSTQSDNEKEKFLRDSLDVFKLEELDVGRVSALFRETTPPEKSVFLSNFMP